MATINSAFNLISGALEADQSALNIVANNVANANTPGLHAAGSQLAREHAGPDQWGQLRNGVSETGATSMRDRVLEERLQQQQQAASASTTRLAALDSVQALFPPDSGSASSSAGDIGSDITGFFDLFRIA